MILFPCTSCPKDLTPILQTSLHTKFDTSCQINQCKGVYRTSEITLPTRARFVIYLFYYKALTQYFFYDVFVFIYENRSILKKKVITVIFSWRKKLISIFMFVPFFRFSLALAKEQVFVHNIGISVTIHLQI